MIAVSSNGSSSPCCCNASFISDLGPRTDDDDDEGDAEAVCENDTMSKYDAIEEAAAAAAGRRLRLFLICLCRMRASLGERDRPVMHEEGDILLLL